MKQKEMKVRNAWTTSCDWLNLPEKSRPAKTKTFLIHSCGRPVLIAARSGERRGTTGSSIDGGPSTAGAGTVGCSEVIVSTLGMDDGGRNPAFGRGDRSRQSSASALLSSNAGASILLRQVQRAATPRGPKRVATAQAGSISTPGLSMPAGSSSALAARSAAAKGAGRWRSYQGRWSRPTAW